MSSLLPFSQEPPATHSPPQEHSSHPSVPTEEDAALAHKILDSSPLATEPKKPHRYKLPDVKQAVQQAIEKKLSLDAPQQLKQRRVEIVTELGHTILETAAFHEDIEVKLKKCQKTISLVKEEMGRMRAIEGVKPAAIKKELGRRLMEPIAHLHELKERILSVPHKSLEMAAALGTIDALLEQIAPADERRALALHALDLAADIPIGSEKTTTFTARDSSHALPFSPTVERYRRTIQPVYLHHHFLPLAQGINKTAQIRLAGIEQIGTVVGEINEGSCEEVAQKIQKRVLEYTASTDYNSLHTVTDFIDFFEKSGGGKELDIYRQFDPEANRLAHLHGASCTGQALALLDILREEFGVQGHAVVERDGPLGPSKHTAAVIPCRDGLILLEPLWMQDAIKIVKPDSSNESEVPGGVQTFYVTSKPDGRSTLHRRQSRPLPGGRLKHEHSEYPLSILPTAPVMLKYMVDRIAFPITRDIDPEPAITLMVDIHEGQVTFKKGEGRNAPRRQIPFAKFSSDEVQADLATFLAGGFLKTPQTQIRAQIQKIIDHQQILKNLSTQLRVPIPTYPTDRTEDPLLLHQARLDAINAG